MTLKVAEFQLPSHSDLRSKAWAFLKSNKPGELKKMSKGKLDRYCEQKAKAAENLAKNLIATGEFPEVAWNLAIRQEILESESD